MLMPAWSGSLLDARRRAPTCSLGVSFVPKALVAGATGFAGALAAHLLWRHPQFDLQTVTARADAGQRLDRLYPRYRVPLELQELDLDRHADVDAAIVAYPHAASAPVVAALRARGVRVVDLSADFRLSELSTYEQWYGPHPHPELLEDASYGLPELHREAIAAADLVATPGCYPTASLLGLAPLARAGLIADLVIDAKQGLSGAGRSATWQTHFSNSGENILPTTSSTIATRRRSSSSWTISTPPIPACGCSSLRILCRWTRASSSTAT